MLGNVPLTIIGAAAAASTGPPSSIELFRALAFGTVFGLVGAAVFWLLAVHGSVHDSRLHPHDAPRR